MAACHTSPIQETLETPEECMTTTWLDPELSDKYVVSGIY